MKALRQDRQPWFQNLAIWTDTAPEVLLLAMPQLAQYRPDPALRQKLVGRPIRTTHAPACHHCTLTRGAGSHVAVYTTHERVICPHHLLWIGDGVTGPAGQFSTSACPEITEAWHHHKNLITRHGHTQVRKAFHISNVINWNWYNQFQHFSAAIDTYESLIAAQPRQANSQALFAAALYPSIVALAASISSPRWRYIARSPHPEPFLDRVSDEVTDGWQPRGTHDPLRHWMDTNWATGLRGSDTIGPPKPKTHSRPRQQSNLAPNPVP
ncbi:hypothetical protein [Arthrobacter alpinus]|uniref:hypothetical protein n=1 Tax=Arthrobacter alpinus TaxID=656366 RepID=UPI001C9466F5|nr:hypothetical protein [Arthrobacter alpinus]